MKLTELKRLIKKEILSESLLSSKVSDEDWDFITKESGGLNVKDRIINKLGRSFAYKPTYQDLASYLRSDGKKDIASASITRIQRRVLAPSYGADSVLVGDQPLEDSKQISELKRLIRKQLKEILSESVQKTDKTNLQEIQISYLSYEKVRNLFDVIKIDIEESKKRWLEISKLTKSGDIDPQLKLHTTFQQELKKIKENIDKVIDLTTI